MLSKKLKKCEEAQVFETDFKEEASFWYNTSERSFSKKTMSLCGDLSLYCLCDTLLCEVAVLGSLYIVRSILHSKNCTTKQ